jgi:hypothetical protein
MRQEPTGRAGRRPLGKRRPDRQWRRRRPVPSGPPFLRPPITVILSPSALVHAHGYGCAHSKDLGPAIDRWGQVAVAPERVVPELTRSAGIQLNDRVSLRREDEILSSPQSYGLADAAPFRPVLAIWGSPLPSLGRRPHSTPIRKPTPRKLVEIGKLG